MDQAKSDIKEYQNYGLTKFYISNKTVDVKDDVFVYLYDATNSKYPRFTIFIIDTPTTVSKSKMNGIFAVFVVPIGKYSRSKILFN
jgi:formylmethanofuran dehydrogenase subunit E-like metal-binding protein